MMGKGKMQASARAALADGKIHKPSDAWSSLDLLRRQVGCGDNQARPTVIDSRSILAGVQGFESLSPHSSISLHSDFALHCQFAIPYIERIEYKYIFGN